MLDCTKCGACLLTQNCRSCINCYDKTKYGGLGIRKKKCRLRVCLLHKVCQRKNTLMDTADWDYFWSDDRLGTVSRFMVPSKIREYGDTITKV